VLPRDEARRLFEEMGQKFKVAIIDRLASDVSSVSVYRTGDFLDLCRGPHVPDSGALTTVKLLRVAGVYWRGDERNPSSAGLRHRLVQPADLAAYLDRLARPSGAITAAWGASSRCSLRRLGPACPTGCPTASSSSTS